MFLSKTKGQSPRAQSKGRVVLSGLVEQRGQQHTHYKGRDTPWDTLTPVVLVAAGLIGVGQSEGPEEIRLSKLRPYERSRCAEHGGVAGSNWHDVRVPPGVVMVAPQTRLRNQREREAKGRARGRRKARGQGKYKGRGPKATPARLPTLRVATTTRHANVLDFLLAVRQLEHVPEEVPAVVAQASFWLALETGVVGLYGVVVIPG